GASFGRSRRAAFTKRHLDRRIAMRAMFRFAAAFVIGIVVGGLTIPAVSAQLNRRTTKFTRLLTADMAGWCDEKEVTIELAEAGPGTSGKHYHPGHCFTWVIAG